MERGVFYRQTAAAAAALPAFSNGQIIPFHSKMQTIPRLCCRDNLFMARLDVFLFFGASRDGTSREKAEWWCFVWVGDFFSCHRCVFVRFYVLHQKTYKEEEFKGM